jgi:copper homeostasis protein (lipoprotein)
VDGGVAAVGYDGPPDPDAPMSRFQTSMTLLVLAMTLALAACDRAADAPAPAAPDATTVAPADADAGATEDNFERTWLGVLPCADCDGIQTRLLLVREGSEQSYELQETYLGADGEAVFDQKGSWTRESDDEERSLYRLDPATPGGRRFELRPDGALELLDGAGRPLDTDGQYRLQRL